MNTTVKLVCATLPNNPDSPPIRLSPTDAPVVVEGHGMRVYRIPVGESAEFSVRRYRLAWLRDFLGLPTWRWIVSEVNF